MPPFIQEALDHERLMETYLARPPYQQNDYISWITQAKRPETQAKRLAQMLDELASGDAYMRMSYRAQHEDG